ncbi:pyridoxamine 5'-phosphate oxidase family protein [Consotaella salsifontis]|uniref:Uncharacterized protein n=1 Tax=Consotaella salsifontis TaxID=1365950 RepID=A0A1T4TCN8_9HYPH|nr:pyridoxamine 5'-phosphate oxidase family protein [Consotaella salsifontis]SKA38193.1 hypothetical protein SAMN05428963_12433 [Consotaella salsifontis]
MANTGKIIAYIRANRVLSLCSVRGSTPWAANCFYALDEQAMVLLFMSERSTRHGSELLDNDQVAGTISSQESNIAKLRGVQFAGRVRCLEGEEQQRGLATYFRKFPFARLKPAPLWAITLYHLKYTDNTFGFGTKMHWQRRGAPADDGAPCTLPGKWPSLR